MKIVTLNAPFLYKFSRTSRSPAISKGGCVYYPIWLGYCTGVLEKAGHDVKLIDATAAGLSYEEVFQMLQEFQPKLVVIDAVTASFNNDKEVAKKIKVILPDAKIIMVGTHATAMPERCLREAPHVDAIARGEYDYTVRDYANAIEKNEPLDNILGLTFRKTENGQEKFVSTAPRPELTTEELDAMPFVSEVYARNLNIKDYFYPSVLYPEVTIITGRGCKFRCTFCKWPQLLTGHNYRERSIQNVVDEFEWIEKNLPYVKDIMVEDDTLTQDRERTKQLCAEIKKRNLKIAWTCNSRADTDYETMKAMKEANCRLICVGFESADQGILNNIKKGIIVNNVKPFVENAKKAGLLIHGCFMMGNRGETPETIRKTIDMAKELDPDTAQFYPIMVYPGTEAYEWARQNNYLTTENWSEWLLPDGTHNTIISTEKLSAKELVRWCDKARIEFYLRPQFIKRKILQVAMHPVRELPRFLISTYIFSKYLVKEVREVMAEKSGRQTELPGFATCKAN